MARLADSAGGRVRCPKHGYRESGVFLTPDPGDAFPAEYVCLHCLKDLGFKPGQQIPAASALLLLKLPLMGILVTPEEHRELKDLLRQIGAYANHLSGCAHWTPQTEECCDCGLSDARGAWDRIHEILGVKR